MVSLNLSRIYYQKAALRAFVNGLISRNNVRPFCAISPINHEPPTASPQPTVIKRVFFWVCDSYYNQPNRTHPVLNLPIDSEFLTQEQAITVVASLADEAGSMVALSFFYWAIGFPKFKHFMRFYIVSATCLIKNANFERTHDVLRCMVANFAEVGMLKEAVDMVFEMHSQGLILSSHTLNCVLNVVNNGTMVGCVEMAENVFDEMCKRGVNPDIYSFKSMVVAYCRIGRVSDADRWLTVMLSRGFLVDNATCSLVINVFCEYGSVNRALWIFYKMVEMGLKPNVINFTCLINGLSKRGSIKQAFELLEEMVRNGLKPNVYTHTTLIDGLCKKGWTDKAFRLFLKLVRSDNYKPNVQTYTAMISGYCKEEKLKRSEMLLHKMREQGLVPNLKTYTILINGHSKVGNFDRAYELMDLMSEDGLTPNIYAYNAVIDGLCKKGRVKEAYRLLKRSYNKNGVSPDKVTYNILICESCKQDSDENCRRTLALVNKMIKYGFPLDIHTYTTVISAFSRQKNMRECERMFNDAINIEGLTPTTQTYTSMISGYCRDSKMDMAKKFFERMRVNGCLPDNFTYDALISGLCKESMLDEAKILCDEMMDRSISPSEVTRVTIAYELCKKDELSTALAILNRLEKKLWVRTISTMTRKLCSEKKVDMAAKLFDKLLDVNQTVDRVTLAAFMTACYNSNNYALVSDMSKRMLKEKG